MTDWLSQLPVLGSLAPSEAATKLREIGEDEIADALSNAALAIPATYEVLPRLRGSGDRAWLHTAHAIGYLAPADGLGHRLLPIQHAASIDPDETLKGARIKLTFDGLRVADYPGGGIHRIWFDFAARNQTHQGPEQLHFNAVYRAAEGEHAAVLGRPIFTGLQVGAEGLFLQLATINVLNESDENLLRFLEGDTFQSGLCLLTTAQPVLAPFSALAVGLTKTIAARHRNVTVQAIDLGLDFSRIAPRPRLAEGSYVAVQVPGSLRSNWRWADWAYESDSGRIVSTKQPDLQIPYNYIIVSISRYQG